MASAHDPRMKAALQDCRDDRGTFEEIINRNGVDADELWSLWLDEYNVRRAVQLRAVAACMAARTDSIVLKGSRL